MILVSFHPPTVLQTLMSGIKRLANGVQVGLLEDIFC
jgi:hypothetical protein